MERSMRGSATIIAEEEACSSSTWKLKMDRMLEESVRWEMTSIYRVPEWIKELTNAKAYRPWLVSMGPFHHGEPDLLPMEEHKRRALVHFITRAKKPVEAFVGAIEKVVDELQGAYQGLDDKWCRGKGKGHFAEMMVIDGCFLLEIMRTHGISTGDDQGGNDYVHNDPVFSTHGLQRLISIIMADMVLVENQLPLLVLERLVTIRDGICPTALQINNSVRQFLRVPKIQEVQGDQGLHLLDIFHDGLCGGRPQHIESDKPETNIPTATELAKAGVHFEVSTSSVVHNVDFKNGVLSIPTWLIDEGTEKELLNLRVFEQVHSSAGRHVTNYLLFMNQLIESERDAGLLRSKGIMKKWFSSDKELADLFNNLTKGAKSNQTKKMNDVMLELQAHYEKRRNQWEAFFWSTYLSNPWVFISLVAATILLLATVMQTVYTVVPFYTKS